MSEPKRDCFHEEQHETQAECDAFDAFIGMAADLEAMRLERDDWRRNAEFAGEKLQESVQRFARASAAQLQAQIDLHELQQAVAQLGQKYEALRYRSTWAKGAPPSMGDVADDIKRLLGTTR